MPDYQTVAGVKYRQGPECSEARGRALLARARRTGGSGIYHDGRVLLRAPQGKRTAAAAAWYDALGEHAPGGGV